MVHTFRLLTHEHHAFVGRQFAHEHQALFLAGRSVREPHGELMSRGAALDGERGLRKCRQFLERRALRVEAVPVNSTVQGAQQGKQ